MVYYVVTPPLNSQLIYKNWFEFYIVTEMGQAPAWNYTDCMKHTQPRSHQSKGLPSKKHGYAQLWGNHLVDWKYGTIGVAWLVSQLSLNSYALNLDRFRR